MWAGIDNITSKTQDMENVSIKSRAAENKEGNKE
jgi:hypothetical protein